MIKAFHPQNRIIRRNCSSSSDETTDAELTELDQLIKLQNKEYFDLYDTIAKNVEKKDQIEILERNLQFIPETKTEVNMFFSDVEK